MFNISNVLPPQVHYEAFEKVGFQNILVLTNTLKPFSGTAVPDPGCRPTGVLKEKPVLRWNSI